MPVVAGRTGAPRTVFVVPPRRDDCELRARIFSPARELPRVAEATLALACLRGRAVRVEEGVIPALAEPLGDGRYVTEAPPPVLGSLDLDDPARAAAALGLTALELDPALPVRAGSCGPNVLLVPLRDRAALDRAALDPDAWRGAIGKARHLGALALVASGPSAPVVTRFFTPEGEEPGNALGACAAAVLLAAHGRGPLTRFERGEGDAARALTVELRRRGAEAWEARVTAEVRRLAGLAVEA